MVGKIESWLGMSANPFSDITPDSDGPHVAGAEPWWREAWYFEFYDARAELQFQAYQGVFPNASSGDLNAAFFHKGQPVHRIEKMDFTVPPDSVEDRLCFGPLKLEQIKPLCKWRLDYDSPEVHAHLTFDAVHPPFSWAAANLSAGDSVGPKQGVHHFDQLGRYTGSVWVGSEELKVDTLGFRDRMWGWGNRKNWRAYLVMWAAFSEDCVVNVVVQKFDGGCQSLTGYLSLDGAPCLLKRASIDVEWDPRRGQTVARINATVEDLRGRRFAFTGCPQGISDTSHRWPQRSDHMMFSVGEYKSGDRVGHGVMNWAFKTEADKIGRLEAATENPGGKVVAND